MDNHMKAIVYTKYGSPEVLGLKDVGKPIPRDDEVLVKVLAVSLNPYDLHFLNADPFFIRLMGSGFFRPKYPILGADIAGRVEAVGGNIRQFKPGDEVFGDVGHGGFAEYVCAHADKLVLKPGHTSFEEAAAVPMAALTALQGLRDKGQLRSGRKVLINGASGGVGTFAVQIAKSFGADVTAVCSTGKREMVRSIGADHVIDYTQEDFTRKGNRYDLILDAVANHSVSDYRQVLNPGGIGVIVGFSTLFRLFEVMTLGEKSSRSGSQKIVSMMVRINNKDLLFIKELLESGKVVPVIDRCYPLSAVPEALQYLSEGHAKGKVVITVEHND